MCARVVSWHWRECREKAVVARAVLSLPSSCWIEVIECPKLHPANLVEERQVNHSHPPRESGEKQHALSKLGPRVQYEEFQFQF